MLENIVKQELESSNFHSMTTWLKIYFSNSLSNFCNSFREKNRVQINFINRKKSINLGNTNNWPFMTTADTFDHFLHSSLQAFVFSSYNNTKDSTLTLKNQLQNQTIKKRTEVKSFHQYTWEPSTTHLVLSLKIPTRDIKNWNTPKMYLQIYTSTDKLEGSFGELLASKRFSNGSKTNNLLLLIFMWGSLCFAVASHFLLSVLSFNELNETETRVFLFQLWALVSGHF